jgi:hypothetical protein
VRRDSAAIVADTTADPDGDVAADIYRWELLLSSAEPDRGLLGDASYRIPN